MNNLKRSLLFGITILVIVAVIIWEYYIQQWEAAQPDNGMSVMRVDLFVIYPLVITLVALSLYQLFRKK
jgi:uncharacterized membrane protein